MVKRPSKFLQIGFLVLTLNSNLAMSLVADCRARLKALQSERTDVQNSFRIAERLEKEGKIPAAKDARLLLAKAVAERANLRWPEGLSDKDAADFIWAAHNLPTLPRRGGLAGLREYFARYTRSEHPDLAGFKKTFGSNLARELLRRGVCGNEQPLLFASGLNPRDRTPRLVLADYLEEHERHASAETLRLRAELETLPAVFENMARREEIRLRLEAIAEKALQEWQASESAVRLSTVGTFNALGENGLPILRPHAREALLSATTEQQKTIVGLDLSQMDWRAPEIARLTKLNLEHVTTLNLSNNRVGDVGAGHLAAKESPFKNVTTLDLTRNQINDAGAGRLAGKDSIFGNVTTLTLSRNNIRAVGAGHLANKSSPFRNVTTLNLYFNRIGNEGAGHLASKDSPFENVTTLDLSDNLIWDAGAGQLAGKDSIFTKVTTLDLSVNMIGDAGAGQLAGKSSPFKNVATLNLRANLIADLGATQLAGKDSPFKKVQRLNLADNHISPDVLRNTESALTGREN